MKETSWKVLLALVGVSYLLLCRALRNQRQRYLQRLYPLRTEKELASMTNDQAWAIQKEAVTLEFPYIVDKALNFALFRTYAIPTISSLLHKTTEFSKSSTAGKRAADTAVLIGEFLQSPPTSERACSGIARMNFIHSKYQKAGKISNEDMIYTLALFALEPARWIKRYEWRELTDLEYCSFGVFWKSVGDAMGISFAPLKSSSQGWRTGIHWLNDLEDWAEKYEAEFMVPAESNRIVADCTVEILAYDLPKSAMPFARKAVATLMDDRLRTAMKYDPAPAWLTFIVHTILQVRRFLIRHCFLPRFNPEVLLGEDPDPVTGRYFRVNYPADPWYVPESYSNGLQAWIRWLSGKGYPSKAFKSEGYHIHELGPFSMSGKGLEEYNATREKLQKSGRGGCPFAKF